MFQDIAVTSHARIAHVTAGLLRCCNSCDLEHRIELLVCGQAIRPLATEL